MKITLRRLLVIYVLIVASLLGPATTPAADDDHSFTVTEGASPWADRIGQWSLTNVPDSLKGFGPLPQGDCSSRSLEVPGKPVSIVIGVQVNDAAKFTEKFPAAMDMGTQIAVKNPTGVTLPYMVFKMSNPPAKIDGAGVFGAGLLLLVLEDGAVPGKLPSAAPKPVTK